MKKGVWSAGEDNKLTSNFQKHGDGGWRSVPQKTSLQRYGKSCRLRSVGIRGNAVVVLVLKQIYCGLDGGKFVKEDELRVELFEAWRLHANLILLIVAGLVADSHSRGGNVSVQTPMVFLGSSLRVDEFEGVHGLVLLNSHSRDHVEQFASGDMDSFQCVTQNVLSDRARENILSMGLLNEADDEVCEMVPCDNDGISWAESVDRAMSAKFGWNKVIAQDTVLEMGSMNFFPELKEYRNKKYDSLYDLQDKVFSVNEKKRRDRALKRDKSYRKKDIVADLANNSPSEPDIVRNQTLLRSTRKTLELGKRVGF
ncbi:hypothetical protein V6N12_017956 [Hibiscus sabdariffa]|uniref:Uncharacterized protein n=1 Tax=Hibiscus sabdariffa TaxID=183260 RepID=A0ABR1ZM34_9ROSI